MRVPEARFLGREAILSDQEVSRQDIEHVVSVISAFSRLTGTSPAWSTPCRGS